MREIGIYVKRFFNDRRLIRSLLKELLAESIALIRRRLYPFRYFDPTLRTDE